MYRRRDAGLGCWFWVAVSSAACGPRDEPAASIEPRPESDLEGVLEPEALPVGPVCPDCLAQSGGETSDFDDTSDCALFLQATPVSDEEAVALGFDMARVRSLVERDFAASFRWARPEETPEGSLLTRLPTGYVNETRVSGSTRIEGDLTYQRLDARLCDAQGTCTPEAVDLEWGAVVESCTSARFERLNVSLRTELETADGAVRADTIASLSLAKGAFASLKARFKADLADVEGTLRVEPRPEGPYYGVLFCELGFHPHAVRGAMTVSLQAPANPAARLEPTYYWEARALSGQWPDDVCRFDAVPIDTPTPDAEAALQAFNDAFAGARESFNAKSPLPAEWKELTDPQTTEVTVVLADSPRPLCLSREGAVTFEVEGRFTTADGRIDWTQQMNSAFSTEPTGIEAHWNGFVSDEAWTASFAGVDLSGAPGARVNFSAFDGSGDLQIITKFPCDEDEPPCVSDFSAWQDGVGPGRRRPELLHLNWGAP